MHQEGLFKDKVWLHYILLCMWRLHLHFVSPTLCNILELKRIVDAERWQHMGGKSSSYNFDHLCTTPAYMGCNHYDLQVLNHFFAHVMIASISLVLSQVNLFSCLTFFNTIILPFSGNFMYISTCLHENLHTGLWIKCKWSQRQTITSNRGRLILSDHCRQLLFSHSAPAGKLLKPEDSS